ncbi:hypothetical protein [Stieleria bergensis]
METIPFNDKQRQAINNPLRPTAGRSLAPAREKRLTATQCVIGESR